MRCSDRVILATDSGYWMIAPDNTVADRPTGAPAVLHPRSTVSCCGVYKIAVAVVDNAPASRLIGLVTSRCHRAAGSVLPHTVTSGSTCPANGSESFGM